ncbi:MAG: Activator of (R)-2-hydroxyglutaryl-CoA dehydratase [Clostridiales bacterium 38_11]|nr:MAG: Activator of (R)-2-hydroxyglutaryl-CoA dehydratase [Clostridiales bacterium 38_11]
MKLLYNVGLDIGSTTVKIVVVDSNYNIIHKEYKRHYSDVRKTVVTIIKNAEVVLKNQRIKINVTGSGAVDISKALNIPFVQEVAASTAAIEQRVPYTDVAIELGGEDAKITYLSGQLEQRMNGTCAGGTGAFIDQMAILLKTDAEGLNELSQNHRVIYPIASRCGVFAKTDIQPLLNEGARKEDIAASVFQAVVNQTISGLAQGRTIKGNVAFLGGPLSFLPALRKRFVETLNLSPEQAIFPEDSHYFVALGAAITAEDTKETDFEHYLNLINSISNDDLIRKKEVDSLFESNEDYETFKKRHNQYSVKRGDIESYKGSAFLGIDAGSTTTKVALIGDQNQLLYSFYTSNEGSPLFSVINALKDLYAKMNNETKIVYSAVTGYGEYLIKSALQVDVGEIETIAHYKAADYFLKGVDFVIDIGGQDMKSLKIKNGVIDSIMLNEACSSGCGSFIETFAKSLNLSVQEFAKLAVESRHPVDLGTRCTVFMNSKVKQAQREGATVGDISAGISYSVIKNALFKVIRLKSIDDLGEKIVAQGGTFLNDSVLRAFELITEREVVRPDIAGIMGAFGAALICKERFSGQYSTLLTPVALDHFSTETTMERCGLCGNNCLMTISKFNDDRIFITGNRCEKGPERILNTKDDVKKVEIPNLYNYKYKRVFDYKSLPMDQAHRGLIGIPRVLNIYEDYPFWHTFLTELGFRVVLSAHSTKKIYELGMETIPSESVCYPGKIAHGHISDLINKKVQKIFYPCVPYTVKEDSEAGNNYNCPVVTSYPETIGANMDIAGKGVVFYKPFVNLDERKSLVIKLYQTFMDEGVTMAEIKTSVASAYKAQAKYMSDIKLEGERSIEFINQNGLLGIVLAGRPYHIDPEINHGIPEMINSYGYVVISEDSIAHLQKPSRPLRVVDQWTYHTRLYAATEFVSKRNDMELVQLNSFGCGLDAVTTDQVHDILVRNNKIYTPIKIDEINNLGAVRIRIRSLLAAMKERKEKNIVAKVLHEESPRILFTKKMKKNYTILAPQMSPIHFQFFKTGAMKSDINLEILPSVDKEAVDEGLKCVNNDACYPSIITTGQMIKALKSGEYDLNKTALMMSQTGGGCRATNYIAFIKKALKDNGYDHIPVISFSAGFEKQPGFSITPKLLHNLMLGMVYGDLFMKVLYKTRPYEKIKGSANKLYDYWVEKCNESILSGGIGHFKETINGIVTDFDNLALDDTVVKPKVGVVGEILVKFHPTANNDIVGLLEDEGAEAVVPGLVDFFLYSAYNPVIKHNDYILRSFRNYILGNVAIYSIELYRNEMKKALLNSKRFSPHLPIQMLAEGAIKHLSLGNQTGEGWLLTAEMVELIESGVDNILCLQPFACLPNHITGKGMIQALKRAYPFSNITPIDYDPGASEVNQINRIKLMLTTANKTLDNRGKLSKKAMNIEAV